MHDAIEVDRRRFLSVAVIAIAGARAGLASVGGAQTPVMTRTLGELKQVNAGVLNVGYAELGPPQGRAVLLLHTCRRRRRGRSLTRSSTATVCDGQGGPDDS